MVDDETLFEEEVIRVGRALFAKDRPFQGATYLDDRERDGVFVGEDAVVVIEATISTRLDKAQKDGRKLEAACNRLSREYKFKAIKGYFVTRDEPTADQRRFIDRLNAPVIACSFAQLRAMLVDSREYLALRDVYPYGSARNPSSGSSADLGDYVPIRLAPPGQDDQKTLSIDDIAERTTTGHTIVILGDFGAGKSMTLRQVHRSLAARHYKFPTSPFPVTLNLRDHQGQKEPDEALRRHAQRVGFDSPSRLVRAWRAGEVHLILDGFDEIATSGWLGQTSDLQQIRRRSVELIRRFVDETPVSAGLVLSGRRHFFDSMSEMQVALGLAVRKPTILATDEFNEDQIRAYLSQYGWDGALPAWVPPRPLLLGYLVGSGSLADLTTNSYAADPAAGWDLLLDRICDRESTMEVGIDGSSIRRVLERLATVARSRASGAGPLFKEDLATAFTEICGYSPDEGSYLLLQRMPGLGTQDLSDGSRHFIDGDMADAARAGDLVRYVISGGGDEFLEKLQGGMTPQRALGISVAAYLAGNAGVSGAQALPMARRLQTKGASDALVFDCTRLSLELGGAGAAPSLDIQGLLLEELVFADEDVDLSAVVIRDCIVELLDVSEYEGNASLPHFERCAFGAVLGAGNVAGLPAGHFVECSFEAFDPTSKTTKGLLAIPGLTPRQRVLLTVLKKTYLQRGGGRKDSALVRGLDDRYRGQVSGILEMLIAEGVLVKGRTGKTTVYYSVRSMGSRVRRILDLGASSEDPLVVHAK